MVNLDKWRHLIEPEISQGLTPVTWEQMLAMRPDVFEGERSVILTRDVVIGTRKSRSIWVAAGVMDEVMRLVSQVEESARQSGIGSVIFMGRRGWLRAASGYREMSVIGLKEL